MLVFGHQSDNVGNIGTSANVSVGIHMKGHHGKFALL